MSSTLSSAPPRWRSPIVLLFVAMVSIHTGAAIAKGLFTVVTPLGIASLRLSLSSLLLWGIARPRWRQHAPQDYGMLALLGLTMGLMNVLLYSAIAYIPIGVAVTLEFLGPLGVALFYSRRGIDVLWVVMAAAGVTLLTPLQGASLNLLGVTLALLSGGCWAAYILLAARVGKVFPGSEGVAMAMTVGAIAILPFGIGTNGAVLLSPKVLGLGAIVAMMASALPYSIEMSALRQIPVRVFGVLMSVEPVVASAVGLVLLGEHLTLRMGAAIALVSLAAAGSAGLSQKTD